MSLNSFFQYFVPKEKKFYPLYIQQADYIEKASKLLHRCFLCLIGVLKRNPICRAFKFSATETKDNRRRARPCFTWSGESQEGNGKGPGAPGEEQGLWLPWLTPQPQLKPFKSSMLHPPVGARLRMPS